MIQIGGTLPEVDFSLLVNGEITNPGTNELFSDKRVVLFAVPGAFTPTCSQAHLPGYVALADKLKAKGIDSIICLSVNDAFVMDAWGKASNAEEIIMLADGNGFFTKQIGLDMNTGNFGGLSEKSSLVPGFVTSPLTKRPKSTSGKVLPTCIMLLS